MQLESIQQLAARAVASIRKLDGAALLLVRLTLGIEFMVTGWGKLQNLDKVTAFFTELGLPLPGFQAHLVASTELVGGGLVLVGLLSRLASLPLMVTMIVAILTAKRSEISSASDLVGLVEFTYFVLFAVVAVFGPGAYSIDAILMRSERRSSK